MNYSHPSTELLFTTVPIQAQNDRGNLSYGTGFIVSIQADDKNSIPVLITNDHVINDAKNIYVEFFKADSGGTNPITNDKVRVEIASSYFSSYRDNRLDVAFVPIAPILKTLSEKNVRVFYKSIDKKLVYSKDKEEKLAAIEEITFIGYPYGLKETLHNLPIVRRGITATPIWPYDKTTFIIDAGVFPGSSGSPVFIYNQGTYSDGLNTVVGTRLVFLGMVKISMQDNNSKQFIGLGEAVKASTIFTFIEEKLSASL